MLTFLKGKYRPDPIGTAMLGYKMRDTFETETLESNNPRARPLTASERKNLKRLLRHPYLRDVRLVIEHLLKRDLKLEQEGVEDF